MNTYEHSVSLDVSRCTGCTMCLKRCPTEAIRIKDGHAIINPDRCIDCGVCIRYCPNNAKKATYSKLDAVMKYKYKVALPAPTLYGQFEELEDVDYVLQGLIDIGFDDVFEVAKAAEYVTEYTRLYLKTEGIKKPVISSACPVVVRLISLRYPYLRDNLMPILPPLEIAAKMARKKAKEEHPELKDADIGLFFISPCPGKVSYIRNGFGDYKSEIDVVISLKDVYFRLIAAMKRDKSPEVASETGMIGVGWASSGGESSAILNDNYLAADGIENVIKVLEDLEDDKFVHLDFVELNACPGGCVGGVLTVENPFIAKSRLMKLRKYSPISCNHLGNRVLPKELLCTSPVEPCDDVMKLADNVSEAMARMKRMKELLPDSIILNKMPTMILPVIMEV